MNNQGVKNSYSLGDLIASPAPGRKGELKAYCLSASCTRHQTEDGKYRFHAFVERKTAKRGDIDCRACGHALFWTRNPDSIAS